MSQSEGRDQTDQTGEFFSIGTPLHAVRAGYVRRRADDLLFDTVLVGGFAHVIAPDNTGKSSLLAATSVRLESRGCKVASLDLAQLSDRDGGTDAGRWHYSVAYRILRQLRIRFDLQNWWQDKSVLGNRQRLVDFYSEILLQNIADPIVIFVDEVQCIENLPHATHLLASIRAAHNARTTDPDFSRLTFVMSGECDPVSLIDEPELSPFNVTQQIPLEDFVREDLDLFATELNLEPKLAERALDRIYYWTSGQPYLSQKLARAVAREARGDNIEADIDHLALSQLAGRAALHNEPHMSHIHRRLVEEGPERERLLNLYGKLRKGIEVTADLGSAAQRRLMAVGLAVIDADGRLAVRNRLYAAVFSTRWANQNLRTNLKVPAAVAAALLLIALVPFWYTQWLPGPYADILTEVNSDVELAVDTYQRFATFPGHSETAARLFGGYLEQRAIASDDESELDRLLDLARRFPVTTRSADELESSFWDRRMKAALRLENRDVALLAALKSLRQSTALRRQRAAALLGDDYPQLLATLPVPPPGTTVLDSDSLTLTTATGAAISQWSWIPQGLQQRDPWTVSALEVTPLVRRVVVDRAGSVSRVGLTLNISHGRLNDLRIKIIAPSGRAVDIETSLEQAGAADDIRIPASQLRDLIGEPLGGTWSISVRDESLGAAGQLVGWNLQLNSQGAVEHFQRGLNIPEPIERDSGDLWFDESGRFVVARAQQSDSARIWDLAFSQPVRAIAVSQSEKLIGLTANAGRLVTASQDRVNVWDTASGDRIAALEVGSASLDARLTEDGNNLFVVRRGDEETELERWSLTSLQREATHLIAGSPAQIAVDRAGRHVATADFDQAVRIWALDSGEQLAQLDLARQPSSIELSPDGQLLGAIYADSGVAVWRVDLPQAPMREESGGGTWALAFSPSGQMFVIGQPRLGYQIYRSSDGRNVGPPVGLRQAGNNVNLLAFNGDETVLTTGTAEQGTRLWQLPTAAADVAASVSSGAALRGPFGDRPVVATPDGLHLIVGDEAGHLHVLPAAVNRQTLDALPGEVSYIGHSSKVSMLAVNRGDGSRAASAAIDGSVRMWSVPGGEPLPWHLYMPGGVIDGLQLSPDGRLLAVRQASVVALIDADSGSEQARFDLGATIGSLSVESRERIFVSASDGRLHGLFRAGDGTWRSQEVYQSDSGIRAIAALSGRSYLAIVDGNNQASLFDTAAGRVLAATVDLPAEVEEIAYAPVGSKVFFRTARWVHRVTASVNGLHWSDAVLLPRPIPGASMVFRRDRPGDPESVPRPALLTGRDGLAEFVPASPVLPGSVGLLGTRDELLSQWTRKISADPRAAF